MTNRLEWIKIYPLEIEDLPSNLRSQLNWAANNNQQGSEVYAHTDGGIFDGTFGFTIDGLMVEDKNIGKSGDSIAATVCTNYHRLCIEDLRNPTFQRYTVGTDAGIGLPDVDCPPRKTRV